MTPTRLVAAFLSKGIDETCALGQRVLTAHGISSVVENLPSAVTLWAARDRLPTEKGAPCAIFFVSPASAGWTGFISNLGDGWYTLVNAMSDQGGKIDIVFVGVDLEKLVYPSTKFEMFRNGESVRRVHAWREDDGWHFVNRGQPLPFEEPAHYSARSIADRFNRAICDQMLTNLGIDLGGLTRERLDESVLLLT